MASGAPAVVLHTCLPELYEQLRAWALDPRRDPVRWPRQLGWQVLVHQGMGRWMAICQQLGETLRDDAGPLRRERQPPVSLSAQTELTAALASLVVSHCQGAGA